MPTEVRDDGRCSELFLQQHVAILFVVGLVFHQYVQGLQGLLRGLIDALYTFMRGSASKPVSEANWRGRDNGSYLPGELEPTYCRVVEPRQHGHEGAEVSKVAAHFGQLDEPLHHGDSLLDVVAHHDARCHPVRHLQSTPKKRK